MNMNEVDYEFCLDREGELPLLFDGVEKGEDLTRPADDRGNPNNAARWYTFRIYETTTQKFVVEVNYHSMYDSERTFNYAEFGNSPNDVYERVIQINNLNHDDDSISRLLKLYSDANWAFGQSI